MKMLVAILCTSPLLAAHAQEEAVGRTWRHLQRDARLGQGVQVELLDGRKHTGRLEAVEGSSIAVEAGSDVAERFGRDQIASVRLQTGSRGELGIVLGALAGILLAGLTTQVTDGEFVTEGTPGGVLLGGILGGAAGSYVPVRRAYFARPPGGPSEEERRAGGRMAERPAEPSRGWAALLEDLSPNRSLRLELEDGAVRLGRSVAADDSSLVVRVRSGALETRFERADLARVGVRTGSRAGRNALIGAAAGATVFITFIALIASEFSGGTFRAVLGAARPSWAWAGRLSPPPSTRERRRCSPCSSCHDETSPPDARS